MFGKQKKPSHQHLTPINQSVNHYIYCFHHIIEPTHSPLPSSTPASLVPCSHRLHSETPSRYHYHASDVLTVSPSPGHRLFSPSHPAQPPQTHQHDRPRNLC